MAHSNLSDKIPSLDTTASLPSIPKEVAEKLGYYVYAYVDPRDQAIFYVGKGGHNLRALHHLTETTGSDKTKRISELKTLGLEPRIDVLAHGLKEAETALHIEAAVIDVLRPFSSLTNQVRGFRTALHGRVPLAELQIQYTAKPAKIAHRCLLIRVNQTYRPGVDALQLYEMTRGIWKVGQRSRNAEYALAVYHGVVRQVFKISDWHPAGTTPYTTMVHRKEHLGGRWEFTGTVADTDAQQYRGRSVATYLRKHSQNPIRYVNC